MARYLIVNADDFGLSQGVNQGIIEAAERGILTSASLMVRQPAASKAATYVRDGAKISVGLHLDLGEWVYQKGEWVPLYSVVSTDDPVAVARELSHQLAEFQRLVGRPPTHVDSHQHVHRQEPVRSLVANLALRLGIAVRELASGIHYCGDFYGQDGEGNSLPDILTAEGFKKILDGLPDGITELGCHPGYGDGLSTAYRKERAAEVRVLCAPEIRAAIAAARIELVSFSNLPHLGANGIAARIPQAKV